MNPSAAPAPEQDERETVARPEDGVVGKLVFALGVGIALLHIYFNVFALLPSLWQNALHFAGFGLMCALLYPLASSRGTRRDTLILAIDMMFGVLVAGSAIYMIAMEDAIYARGVHLAPAEWVCGSILLLGAIEFTRRTTGWIIPVLIVLSLSYVGWWGALVSGVFKFGGLSAETILFRSIYGDDGLFGNIALISSTFVFMFILFGAFLLRSGAGDFVIDLARSVAGKTVGGPGLVAVFASGLTGTISGSAVANTASTGVITIPLMKKAGFPAKFAAAVEAAASTGGQLMPPIMGAGAFVMASYTQIPYTTIIAVSAVPALLYFASVAFFVRIEAKRSGVQLMDGDDVPRPLEVMRRGGLPFLLPVTVLIALLVAGFTPTYAAGISILAVVAASWLTPNKMGPRAIIEALALGSRNMVMTGVLLCAIGLVVNVIATAGVGNTFSLMITEWAGSNLFIAITLIALASLVLGMGLPVTASYIVLGTLSAPALYNLIADAQVIEMIANGTLGAEAKAVLMLIAPDQIAALGAPMSIEAATALFAKVPIDLGDALRTSVLDRQSLTFALLSAHMIIFWLSQDSNVTPPVCLTAFTAAAIAKTPPMATGLASWKVAKGLYIVPLLFAYTPLLGGTWLTVAQIAIFALIGMYAFSAALQGHFENPLSWPMRIAFTASALLLLWPSSLWIHGVGVIGFAALAMINLRQKSGVA
ncbi:MAG: TRAP transporter fused permease subunit [Rhodocyclaceae bacterium]|nr:TRAP transporter fused permease subunit [Rhodocyclaceae bacterium]